MRNSDEVQVLCEQLLALSVARDVKIAVAESLTGGLLAAALVSVPGASRAFAGGVVAYDTALKHTLLGVEAGILRERGPVDAEVARQMARGVRAACAVPGRPGGVDLGIATTGVAGPDPDPQSGQPAGVVWIAVSFGDESCTEQLTLTGDRGTIRAASVAAALRVAIDVLLAADRRNMT
ncbi:CinA family protein [Leucobacter insecticola]|uniref:CinA family protein n=1 Tax=Leucobacter insecticola TaxID=2714934 RepID=A0A6G8FKV1_9MICO|nr:CinA family protein [Leucobacter insecticola]QIM16913.1 CinA family protein [Leucobacter insecticola]